MFPINIKGEGFLIIKNKVIFAEKRQVTAKINLDNLVNKYNVALKV